jgi:eukaryotic-like serine/threonine-protein kinase
MQTCRICDAHSADDLRYCGACGEPLREDVPVKPRGRPSQVIPVGTIVGSYRLLEVIGEGGMGRVYLAEHIRLGRKVALKMLRSKYSQNPDAVKRFFTEARAVNRIAHENIVEVTDFVSEPDGASYYIMEVLTGGSLFDVLHHERVIPLARALEIVVQVANALAAVHEAGIVHRDLKPDNIFLAQRGSRTDLVKLLDFGIAKLVDPEVGISIQRTGVGTLMGTPAYMSPEQASAGPVDYRSDIYSLGVILYELVTGTVPFQGGSYGEILVQHLTQTPRRPSTFDHLPHPIPPELERLILHCLSKDVATRPQSMGEVEEKLRAILVSLARGDIVLTAPTWPTMPVALPPDDLDDDVPRRGRRIAIVAATAFVVGVAVAGAWLFMPGLGGDEVKDDAAKVVPESSAAPEPASPVEPEPITLTIRSIPSGAEVFVAGRDAPLGLTPLETRVARSDGAAVFEIRKTGFEPVSQSVKLSEDVFISVGLSPTAQPPPPEEQSAVEDVDKRPPRRRQERPNRRERKRVDKSGVIDAFQEGSQ